MKSRFAAVSLILLFGAPLTGTPAAVEEPFPTAAEAPPFVYAIDAATIRSQCKSAIARARVKIDAITGPGRKTTVFSSVVKPLEDAFADSNDETMVDTLESSVSTDAKARDASFKCQDDIAAFGNAVDANPVLYAAVADAARSRYRDFTRRSQTHVALARDVQARGRGSLARKA